MGVCTNGVHLSQQIDYWRDNYDWRAVEREINFFAHYKMAIDAVPIHFIREPGKGPKPIPLIMTHGWPWTFWDFHKVIRPLAHPASYGGDPRDAFDVVVPSLPGYGFQPLTTPGISYWRTADFWVALMRDVLGYDKFAAQGGDWGAIVTTQLGDKYATPDRDSPSPAGQSGFLRRQTRSGQRTLAPAKRPGPNTTVNS